MDEKNFLKIICIQCVRKWYVTSWLARIWNTSIITLWSGCIDTFGRKSVVANFQNALYQE